MKKRIYLIICLCLLTLFSFGCQSAHNNNTTHVIEYEGECSIYMTEHESGFVYIPKIVGWVALSTIPDSLTLVCSDEEVELDIKSVTVSSAGLYILSFKQEHVFNDLEKGENPINLLVQIGSKVFEIKNFDVFNCNDDYVKVVTAFVDFDDEDWSASIPIIGMEAIWWWTPFY